MRETINTTDKKLETLYWPVSQRIKATTNELLLSVSVTHCFSKSSSTFFKTSAFFTTMTGLLSVTLRRTLQDLVHTNFILRARRSLALLRRPLLYAVKCSLT